MIATPATSSNHTRLEGSKSCLMSIKHALALPPPAPHGTLSSLALSSSAGQKADGSVLLPQFCGSKLRGGASTFFVPEQSGLCFSAICRVRRLRCTRLTQPELRAAESSPASSAAAVIVLFQSLQPDRGRCRFGSVAESDEIGHNPKASMPEVPLISIHPPRTTSRSE
jgi:hypothetical protein